MQIINKLLVEEVSQSAKTLPRLRMNFNFHATLDARVQRMLNAMEPGTYVRPHKHGDPGKEEAFIVIRGKFLVVEFDSQGGIISHAVLSQNNGNYGVEIPAGTWHAIFPLEPGSVVYEVKDGPYSPINDKDFAPWAPAEGEPGCGEYIRLLMERCGIFNGLENKI